MKVSIVYQCTGAHGWSIAETYVNAARRLGLLHRTFAPRARWGASKPKQDDGLADFLVHAGPEDIVLLCGFDWHSQPLHRCARFRRLLQRSRATRVGIFQEHLSAPWIAADPSASEQFHSALLSALPLLSHVACNHEGDVAHLRAMGVDLPVEFIPFAADLDVFCEITPFAARPLKAFFRGKQQRLLDTDPYHLRNGLIESTRGREAFVYEALSEPSFLDRQGMLRSYVADLNAYAIQLNLPSLSRSMTCRPFEIAACGGVLVQPAAEGEIGSRLFPPNTFVSFDPGSAQSLVDAVEFCRREPREAARRAAAASALVRAEHSGEQRMRQLLRWVGDRRGAHERDASSFGLALTTSG